MNTTKIIVDSFSGFCSALVGLIIASQLLAAHPGIGTVGGTIAGAFVI